MIRTALRAVSLTVVALPLRLPRLVTSSGAPLGANNVLGADFSGPYPASNDGETYALQGVEVGHTDLGLLYCCKDKSDPSADSGVAEFIRTLETQGNKKVVRFHSDQDNAFVKGELAARLLTTTKLNKQTRVLTSPPRMRSLNGASG